MVSGFKLKYIGAAVFFCLPLDGGRGTHEVGRGVNVVVAGFSLRFLSSFPNVSIGNLDLVTFCDPSRAAGLIWEIV